MTHSTVRKLYSIITAFIWTTKWPLFLDTFKILLKNYLTQLYFGYFVIYYQRKGLADEKICSSCFLYKDILIGIIIRSFCFFLALLSCTSLLQMKYFGNPAGAGSTFAFFTFILLCIILGYLTKYVVNKEDVYLSPENVFIFEPLFSNLNLDFPLQRNYYLFILFRKFIISILIFIISFTASKLFFLFMSKA